MAYGFQILSSSGDSQIDSQSSYINYRVLQSGSGSGNTVINFTNQSSIPLIFIRGASGVFFYLANLATNTMTIRSTGAFDYTILVPTTANATSTHGMRVWNDSGVLVFDSGFQNIMIDYYQSISLTFPQTITVPTPSVGLRYILANPLVNYRAFSVQIDISVYEVELFFIRVKINSETSILVDTVSTFQTQGSPFDFDLTNQIPFVAAYLNI